MNRLSQLQYASRRSRGRDGFTLIEVLVAMTIVTMLVLMMTRVYTDGAKAVTTGTRNMERNVNARAVMDFIARELSMAAFEFGDETTSNYLGMAYYADDTDPIYGYQADEISFVLLNKDILDLSSPSDDGQRRSAMQVTYFVDNMEDLADAPENAEHRYALFRYARHPSPAGNDYATYFSEQDSVNWMEPGGSRASVTRDDIIVENVRTFEIFAYTDEQGSHANSWKSWETGNPRLAFLDIYLETMDENDARRIAALAANLGENNATVQEQVERAVKRNYRRVYLYNKQGYQDVAN